MGIFKRKSKVISNEITMLPPSKCAGCGKDVNYSLLNDMNLVICSDDCFEILNDICAE